MKKFFKSKIFGWGLIASLVVVLILVFRKSGSAEAVKGLLKKNPDTGGASSKSSSSKTSMWRDDTFPLTKGSMGPKVQVLQQIINKYFPVKIGDDGKYGSETYDAFEKYFNDTEISAADYDFILKKYNLPADNSKKIMNPTDIRYGETLYAGSVFGVYRGSWDGKTFSISGTANTTKDGYMGKFVSMFGDGFAIVQGIGANAGMYFKVTLALSYVIR